MIEPRPYTALIRTYNSAPLVFRVVAALRAQSYPPASIVAVDSGSDPAEISRLRVTVDKLIDLSKQTFNYSRAINVGVQQCDTPYVLIISSHVLLHDESVMERFIDEMCKGGFEVGFMISQADKVWACREVNSESFSGTNGLTNSCSFLPVSLVARLPFREEVFSAEDQEWTARYLQATDGKMLGISTRFISYLNPRFSYAKKLNEELALAYYVDRKRMRADRIGLWLAKALWSLFRHDLNKAKFRLSVARGLIDARRAAPMKSSRYFQDDAAGRQRNQPLT
jgi:glycosyltransferase involved in cell wall biosynthesis